MARGWRVTAPVLASLQNLLEYSFVFTSTMALNGAVAVLIKGFMFGLEFLNFRFCRCKSLRRHWIGWNFKGTIMDAEEVKVYCNHFIFISAVI